LGLYSSKVKGLDANSRRRLLGVRVLGDSKKDPILLPSLEDLDLTDV
jgi:hypothetical protein